MTNFIAHNSVTRRYLKRGELMAKRFTSSSLRGADGKQTEGCVWQIKKRRHYCLT